MPIARDLTDQRFGKLVVLAPAGKNNWRHPKRCWRCRCDCGAVEVIEQPRLTGKTRPYRACTACRQPDCVVCGTKIPLSVDSKTTCSEPCKTAHERALARKHYYEKVERNPNVNREKYIKLQERAKHDPDLAQRLKEYAQRRAQIRRERRRNDPEWRETQNRKSQTYYYRYRDTILARRKHIRKTDPIHNARRNAQARKRYLASREETLAARRRRWLALTPSEKRAERDAQRRRWREWQRRWRAALRQDPAAYRAQQAKEREWERDRRLRQLFANLDKLNTPPDNE